MNFENNSLDNSIGTSIFGDTLFPDDVSMAMGWNFALNDSSERAVIDFILSEDSVPSEFFLTHRDPQTDVDLYLSSNFETTPIPEPSTMVLLGMGLVALISTVRCVSGRKNISHNYDAGFTRCPIINEALSTSGRCYVSADSDLQERRNSFV